MKKIFFILIVAVALVGGVRADDEHDKNDEKHDSDRFEFKAGTLVLSRSVYVGTPSLLTTGTTKLPPGCVPPPAAGVAVDLVAGGSINVKVKGCAVLATADGTYPTVFNNDGTDGSFGITSPIFLDSMTTHGKLLGTLSIPSNQIVTSFSSKSELALNRSTDGKSITFVGYRGGPGNVTGTHILDVSNSNTPGVVDPTNPVVSQYYRSVAEVDADGNLQITEGNAYSGNNGRAAIKAHSFYYLTGNDNNGNLSSSQLLVTKVGVELINSTGVELLVPTQAPPLPPNINKIGDFEINQVVDPSTCPPPPASPGPCTKYALDKAGKDNNFRGLTIHDDKLYATKGSGSNGINTVYQVGNQVPTDLSTLATQPITILPGFPTTLAADGATARYPFGIWFANDHTLYVADEGDGCAANGGAPCADIKVVSAVAPVVTPSDVANSVYAHAAGQTKAGLEKWVFDTATSMWGLAYTIQSGLNLGTTYPISDGPVGAFPTGTNALTGLPWAPVTDGLRNITGRINGDGTVTIWAVTSTVSGSGDQGADPNLLLRVTDRLNATTSSVGDGDHDRDDSLDHFVVVRAAKSGEVLRGISFAPEDRENEHHYDDDGD